MVKKLQWLLNAIFIHCKRWVKICLYKTKKNPHKVFSKWCETSFCSHKGWRSFLELSSILGQAGPGWSMQANIEEYVNATNTIWAKSHPAIAKRKFSFVKWWREGRKRHGWWSSKKSRDFCWENKKLLNTNTNNWTKWQLCTAFEQISHFEL